MEFVCKDPLATVRGANVKATLAGFQTMQSAGQWLIRQHGIEPEQLSPDARVPVQAWLDAMRQLQERSGGRLLEGIGRAIIEAAHFPPELDSVEKVVMALDTIYYLNHEGDVGHYHVERGDDGELVVECSTPYPRAFEHGLLQGIASHPRLTGAKSYAVEYVELEQGDRTCRITLRPKG